jgi:hypothetical protein
MAINIASRVLLTATLQDVGSRRGRQLDDEFNMLDGEFVEKCREADDQTHQEWRHQPTAAEGDGFDCTLDPVHVFPRPTAIAVSRSTTLRRPTKQTFLLHNPQLRRTSGNQAPSVPPECRLRRRGRERALQRLREGVYLIIVFSHRERKYFFFEFLEPSGACREVDASPLDRSRLSSHAQNFFAFGNNTDWMNILPLEILD